MKLALAKTILFYLCFMSILILSHLFLYYFILSDLYFIPILPDRENRASILIVLPLFQTYFKARLNRVVYFISIFSKQVEK